MLNVVCGQKCFIGGLFTPQPLTKNLFVLTLTPQQDATRNASQQLSHQLLSPNGSKNVRILASALRSGRSRVRGATGGRQHGSSGDWLHCEILFSGLCDFSHRADAKSRRTARFRLHSFIFALTGFNPGTIILPISLSLCVEAIRRRKTAPEMGYGVSFHPLESQIEEVFSCVPA